MRQARIAFSLLAVVAVAGCQEDPEPVTQVPAPAPYDSSYTPIDPVAIDPGTASGSFEPGSAAGQPGGAAAAPGVPGVAANTYTIQKGDTLWSIATAVYGDGQKWVDIAQANPSVDPAKLAIGQQITLP